jgi:hypothetical protein
MMHDRGKSDFAIVAVKPTNNAGQPAAEPAEPTATSVRKPAMNSRRHVRRISRWNPTPAKAVWE